jgi:hypothetical protein
MALGEPSYEWASPTPNVRTWTTAYSAPRQVPLSFHQKMEEPGKTAPPTCRWNGTARIALAKSQ